MFSVTQRSRHSHSPLTTMGVVCFMIADGAQNVSPHQLKKNMSESGEFCENRTESILVLNLGTSCLSYFRALNHAEVSTRFHASLLLLKFNMHTSHFNGFFSLWTPEKHEKYKQTRWFRHCGCFLLSGRDQRAKLWSAWQGSHLPGGSGGGAGSRATCTGTALQCPPPRCSQEWSCPLTPIPELLL